MFFFNLINFNCRVISNFSNLKSQKMDKEKTNPVNCLRKKQKKLRTMPLQLQPKRHKVRNENIQRYVSVEFPGLY